MLIYCLLIRVSCAPFTGMFFPNPLQMYDKLIVDSISLFLPTIIKELGYTASTAQLLTIPIYITAAVLAVAVAWFSDRQGQRSPFILVCMSAIGIGFLICITASGRGLPGLVYAGVFIAVCGIYPAFPGNVTWLSNNLAGSYKRSAGMAIQIGVGNLGGGEFPFGGFRLGFTLNRNVAMASNFYRKNDSPEYLLGHGLELAFVVVGTIAVLGMRFNYKRINKKRDAVPLEHYADGDMSRLGDRAPTFRYVL